MRHALRRFGLFWVDFVLGDDWTLAVVVVVALLVTWGLSRTGFPAWVAMMVIVLAALVGSVARARRAADRRRNAE
jgi:Flp pilus assembly protein TadB